MPCTDPRPSIPAAAATLISQTDYRQRLSGLTLQVQLIHRVTQLFKLYRPARNFQDIAVLQLHLHLKLPRTKVLSLELVDPAKCGVHGGKKAVTELGAKKSESAGLGLKPIEKGHSKPFNYESQSQRLVIRAQ